MTKTAYKSWELSKSVFVIVSIGKTMTTVKNFWKKTHDKHRFWLTTVASCRLRCTVGNACKAKYNHGFWYDTGQVIPKTWKNV